MTRTLAALAALLALTLAACGSSPPKGPSDALVTYCVDRTVRMYEDHHLPFTIPADQRPGVCRKLLQDEGITTKAQFEVAIRLTESSLP